MALDAADELDRLGDAMTIDPRTCLRCARHRGGKWSSTISTSRRRAAPAGAVREAVDEALDAADGTADPAAITTTVVEALVGDDEDEVDDEALPPTCLGL
jgi:hypothetical protein